MFIRLIMAAAFLLAVHAPGAAIGAESPAAEIERGRFLVSFGGCNDCHTPGYAEAAGKLDESQWLTGSEVGFRGPWGTSYAGNLRLDAANLTEAQWIAFARAPRLPPMPWFSLAALPDEDLLAIYRYIRGLGPAGVAAPLAAGPGVKVKTPFIVFEPQLDVDQVAAAKPRRAAR